MEILSRRRRITNLQIILGAELEKAFQTGRRVLGALAFVAMRQKHDKPAFLLPFILGSGYILIDDHLSAVGKIAELGFPYYQVVRGR